jgi:DNA-binding response OmpR family regulator
MSRRNPSFVVLLHHRDNQGGLTRSELGVYRALTDNIDTWVSTDTLGDATYSKSDRSLPVMIYRIRRWLAVHEPGWEILNSRGKGYCLQKKRNK